MRRDGKGLVVGVGLSLVLAGGIGLGCRSGGAFEKGNTYPVQLSRDIPAAKGNVRITPEKDGSQKVKLEVEHIAQPQTLDPQATTYVVWLKTPQGPPMNAGVLHVSDKLKGEFETRTPFKEFEMFVTPEQRPDAQTPRQKQVLRARVDQPAGGTF